MSVRGNAASRGMTAHDRIRLTGPFAENSSNTPNRHLSQVAKTGSAGLQTGCPEGLLALRDFARP